MIHHLYLERDRGYRWVAEASTGTLITGCVAAGSGSPRCCTLRVTSGAGPLGWPLASVGRGSCPVPERVKETVWPAATLRQNGGLRLGLVIDGSELWRKSRRSVLGKDDDKGVVA